MTMVIVVIQWLWWLQVSWYEGGGAYVNVYFQHGSVVSVDNDIVLLVTLVSTLALMAVVVLEPLPWQRNDNIYMHSTFVSSSVWPVYRTLYQVGQFFYPSFWMSLGREGSLAHFHLIATLVGLHVVPLL